MKLNDSKRRNLKGNFFFCQRAKHAKLYYSNRSPGIFDSSELSAKGPQFLPWIYPSTGAGQRENAQG